MQNESNIPVLTDLIEKGIEITLSELGLDQDQDMVILEDDSPTTDIDESALEARNPKYPARTSARH